MCKALTFCMMFSLLFASGQRSYGDVFGLGDLPGGVYQSLATGISSDGSTVVGVSGSEIGDEAFWWTAETGIQGLGTLPGSPDPRSYALGVSSNGTTIVGHSDGPNGIEAFRWTAGSGMQGMGDLPGGTFESYATAISDDGSVIVGYSNGVNGNEAFRWTSSTGMQGIGPTTIRANAINSDGTVIAGTGSNGGNSEAFIWTNDTGIVFLGDLPGDRVQSTAIAISGDGSTVVGASYSENGYEAFLWNAELGMIGLGDLPGGEFFSQADAVSYDGSVVVGSSVGEDGVNEVFVFTLEHGMRRLEDLLLAQGDDLSYWRRLSVAHGISADGQSIVGFGTRSVGGAEAFIATLHAIPEPNSSLLMLATAFGFLVRRRGMKNCR